MELIVSTRRLESYLIQTHLMFRLPSDFQPRSGLERFQELVELCRVPGLLKHPWPRLAFHQVLNVDWLHEVASQNLGQHYGLLGRHVLVVGAERRDNHQEPPSHLLNTLLVKALKLKLTSVRNFAAFASWSVSRYI